MRFKRLATTVGAILLVGGFATSAYAVTTATPAVVSNTAARSIIRVDSTGLDIAGGVTSNYQQCWRSDAVPQFTDIADEVQDDAIPAPLQIGGSGDLVDHFAVARHSGRA